ncbi:ABC transporter related protein [Methanocaldococcus infernus ME]|uniref:ABC transporter related protein n=1 Tax=Methanocaldococcus infernus (strain DSM 11812 / JCM 15783 / ME) TaxID=573063 RepID=D5VS31_METIM|nr:ABC transporter ATP-binding protein [Methanocaldococcus infernus]ADG13384.1 ABC transporter related protein [Methanocaldococcus infernus ME]
MLEVKNLSYSYGEHEVLKDISFVVNKGELCAIFGPNGAGKSTLFKCIIGFLKPNRGEIHVNGQDITKMPIEKIAKLIAYVPQEHKPPFPYLVKEVVLMGRTPHLNGIFGPKKEDVDKAIKAMEAIGVINLADKPYTDLSGGQRQLVLLARALAQETEVMVLDEPTSALDFRNQLKIWNILKKLAKSGMSIIVSVHDPNLMMWFCDKVIVLHKKRILAYGNPQETLTEEVLKSLYGDICEIKNIDKFKIVVPKL